MNTHRREALTMPTEDDKDSAGLRFEGEAHRLHLRRPRLDRDGLYLFGRRYAAQGVTLGEDDLRTLRRGRSEEHTSELQSRPHLVCRLLLEKKKNAHKQRLKE